MNFLNLFYSHLYAPQRYIAVSFTNALFVCRFGQKRLPNALNVTNNPLVYGIGR